MSCEDANLGATLYGYFFVSYCYSSALYVIYCHMSVRAISQKWLRVKWQIRCKYLPYDVISEIKDWWCHLHWPIFTVAERVFNIFHFHFWINWSFDSEIAPKSCVAFFTFTCWNCFRTPQAGCFARLWISLLAWFQCFTALPNDHFQTLFLQIHLLITEFINIHIDMLQGPVIHTNIFVALQVIFVVFGIHYYNIPTALVKRGKFQMLLCWYYDSSVLVSVFWVSMISNIFCVYTYIVPWFLIYQCKWMAQDDFV